MMDITWLATTGPCKLFTAGQHIPCPGGSDSSGQAMYILLTGRVDVYRASAAGGTQTVGSLLPGDVLGGRELFTDAGDSDYVAGIDSVVFVLTEDSFNDLSWSRPDILFEVFRSAYMPLRKMTASQKTIQMVQTKAAPENVSELRTLAKQKKALELLAEGAGKDAAAAEMLQLHVQPAMQAPENSLFPVGHRLYPGITKPEFNKLVFPKEYDCPLCKKKFTDYRIFRSKLHESAPLRFDLRRFYTDFQTEWYDIVTCRHCFFSTFHNYFTEPKPIQKVKFEDELVAARSMVHMDFSAERDIDFVFTAHYLAILCSEGYLSIGRQMRAKLWGNLSWLYEDIDDEEMAKFCADKAAAAYEVVYAESTLTPVQEQITCLSIAGMQFRAGVDRDFKKYLFTAKTQKQGDKSYTKVAADFMYELRGE